MPKCLSLRSIIPRSAVSRDRLLSGCATARYGTRYSKNRAAYGFTGKVSTRSSGSKISYSFSHVSVSQSVNTTLLPTEHMVHIYTHSVLNE